MNTSSFATEFVIYDKKVAQNFLAEDNKPKKYFKGDTINLEKEFQEGLDFLRKYFPGDEVCHIKKML